MSKRKPTPPETPFRLALIDCMADDVASLVIDIETQADLYRDARKARHKAKEKEAHHEMMKIAPFFYSIVMDWVPLGIQFGDLLSCIHGGDTGSRTRLLLIHLMQWYILCLKEDVDETAAKKVANDLHDAMMMKDGK